MTRRLSILVAVVHVAAWVATNAVEAHDFWIEPSSFSPAPGSGVAVALRVGQGFHGDPVPRPDARIRRFVLLDERGATPLTGAPNADPAGGAHVGAAGLAVLGFHGRPATITLEGPKFEAYLLEEGLERIVAERAAEDQSADPGRERYSRCAKALLRVGGNDAAATDRTLGCEFELFPETIPTGRAAGALVVRALYEGAPVEGVKVVALSRTPGSKAVAARTDARGRATLDLDRAGVWLVKAVHMVEARGEPEADWESFWASITFEVRAD